MVKRKKFRSSTSSAIGWGGSDTENEEDQYAAPSMRNVVSTQSEFQRPFTIQLLPEFMPLLYAIERFSDKCKGRAASFVHVDYLKEKFGSVLQRFASTREYCESARSAGMPVNFSFTRDLEQIELIWTSIWETVKDYQSGDTPKNDVGVSKSRQIYLSDVDVTLAVVKAMLDVSSAPNQPIRADLVVRLLSEINCDMELFRKLVPCMIKLGYLLHFESDGQDETVFISRIDDESAKRKLLEDTILAFFVKQARKKTMEYMFNFQNFVDKVEPNLYLVTHTCNCSQIINDAHQLQIPVQVVNDSTRLIFTGPLQALHDFEEDAENRRRYGF